MGINFAKYYKPIQGENLWPKEVQKNLVYREFLPARELQPYVACFWTVNTQKSINKPVIGRIIPDGCMDIVFNLDELSEGKSGVVVGVMTKPDIKIIEGVRNFVGVRFWPGGIIPFLRISAVEFTDDLVSIEDLWGRESNAMNESIYTESTFSKKVKVIENKLFKMLKDLNESDQIINFALLKILASRGVIPINQLVRELDISQRQLSRKFKEWIGITPKKFCSIVRFQNIVFELNKSADNLSNIDWLDIALENGYYDQAHFIREFQKLYGKTPGHL